MKGRGGEGRGGESEGNRGGVQGGENTEKTEIMINGSNLTRN